MILSSLLQLRSQSDKEPSSLSTSIEWFIIIIIILNVSMVVLESYADLYEKYQIAFKVFEIVSVVIFSIEYVVRLMLVIHEVRDKGQSSKQIVKYIFSANALIDLVAILPFYLGLFIDLRSIRSLRILRLLRLLKLDRHMGSLNLIIKVFRDNSKELGITVCATLIILLIASIMMFYIEGDEQPDKFPNIPATLWWAIATLTTVGYGDVFPVTSIGRLLSGIIALLGIGLVALPTGILSAAFLEELQARRKEKKSAEICPHCGKPLNLHD